jgi:hypothetical protein
MDLYNILINVGIGLLDEGLAKVNKSYAGMSAQDLGRAGLFVGSLALDYMGKGVSKKTAETIEGASALLLTKTVVAKVMKTSYSRVLVSQPAFVASQPIAPAPRTVASVNSY